MIYLTGQLLIFLLVTVFLGFLIGWLLRGAMLPVSMVDNKEFVYHVASPHADDKTYQYVKQANQGSFGEPEPVDA